MAVDLATIISTLKEISDEGILITGLYVQFQIAIWTWTQVAIYLRLPALLFYPVLIAVSITWIHFLSLSNTIWSAREPLWIPPSQWMCIFPRPWAPYPVRYHSEHDAVNHREAKRQFRREALWGLCCSTGLQLVCAIAQMIFTYPLYVPVVLYYASYLLIVNRFFDEDPPLGQKPLLQGGLIRVQRALRVACLRVLLPHLPAEIKYLIFEHTFEQLVMDEDFKSIIALLRVNSGIRRLFQAKLNRSVIVRGHFQASKLISIVTEARAPNLAPAFAVSVRVGEPNTLFKLLSVLEVLPSSQFVDSIELELTIAESTYVDHRKETTCILLDNLETRERIRLVNPYNSPNLRLRIPPSYLKGGSSDRLASLFQPENLVFLYLIGNCAYTRLVFELPCLQSGYGTALKHLAEAPRRLQERYNASIHMIVICWTENLDSFVPPQIETPLSETDFRIIPLAIADCEMWSFSSLARRGLDCWTELDRLLCS